MASSDQNSMVKLTVVGNQTQPDDVDGLRKLLQVLLLSLSALIFHHFPGKTHLHQNLNPKLERVEEKDQFQDILEAADVITEDL